MPSLPLCHVQLKSALADVFSECLRSNKESRAIAAAESSTQAAMINAELSLIWSVKISSIMTFYFFGQQK